jgi:hypothetical protein
MRYSILLIILSFSLTLKAQVEAYHPELLGDYLSLRDLTMNENDVYFTIQSVMNELSAIAYFKQVDDRASEIEIASFSGQYMDLEPFLSPNGLRLYFASDRPIHPDSTNRNDYNIWFVERTAKNKMWSDPIYMQAPVNSVANEFYPSVANSGNIYFTSDRSSSLGGDDLYFAPLYDGSYVEVIQLDTAINSSGYEYNAYISPDEDLLIFGAYNREDSYGSGDLYLSRKNELGKWEKAINMGQEINSDKMDYCPFYDHTDSTLYFTSRRSQVNNDAYSKKDLESIKAEINKYANGLSRIYKIKLAL